MLPHSKVNPFKYNIPEFNIKIKLFLFYSFELIHKVNLSEQVAKMLSGCNDIIKQHKDACMKITALMACKDSLWVGTSSGVLLTVHKAANKPVVTGRLMLIYFVGCIFMYFCKYSHSKWTHGTRSGIGMCAKRRWNWGCRNYNGFQKVSLLLPEKILCLTEYFYYFFLNRSFDSTKSTSPTEGSSYYVISGGDGYEDFLKDDTNPVSEVAGREDSTNHLLVWEV